MDIDMSTRLEQLKDAFAQSREHMIEAHNRLTSLTARAESRDGSVVVTLDAQGQISELLLRGDAHRDLDGEEFSRQILAVVREAQTQLRRSMAELMPRSPWGGMSMAEMLDPQTDLTALLPESLFGPSGPAMPGGVDRRDRGGARRG